MLPPAGSSEGEYAEGFSGAKHSKVKISKTNNTT